MMRRTAVMLAAVATMAVGGAAGCGAADGRVEAPRTAALDGRAFRIVVASDRGGAPDTVEITFARGALDTSDARAEGAVPAPYAVRRGEEATRFEAETRAPGAVRRFSGVVAGAHIEGAFVLSRDGLPPARYTFQGDAI